MIVHQVYMSHVALLLNGLLMQVMGTTTIVITNYWLKNYSSLTDNLMILTNLVNALLQYNYYNDKIWVWSNQTTDDETQKGYLIIITDHISQLMNGLLNVAKFL